ncbi:MAG: rhamnogalacturonan acetylesterase [Candidatus Marinimicrobia bacterium]|nr:rhamnogalacturonan acetylesterase [Candidatus Neomarinimicrobiota bacterium]
MKTKTLFLIVILMLSALWLIAGPKKPTLHLIGDSTMADKPLDDNPERGWGQVLPLFFSQDIQIINYAKNGRSTKSFLREGLWDKVKSNLKEGDFVFIQLGHNDAKETDTTRFAAPHTDYRHNLLRFITESREKEAVPVLITPVNRRKFEPETSEFIDQHGEYPAVVRELAMQYDLPLIDLHQSSLNYFQYLGPEKSELLFLRAPAGVYKFYPEGKSDNTHFNRQGALEIARLVIEGMKAINLPLVKYLKKAPELSNIGSGKVVGLDYYYNHEYKKGQPYHYIWEDRENSGFYELGNLFENNDAFICHMDSAPTTETLSKLSLYIIVDPDTPKETEKPNTITLQDADIIENWVKEGGLLLMMSNDSGNAEFEHFNWLAERFGLHFKEVSLNRVEAKNYDMAKFINLPDHPIFNNISKIYMKEISTLELSGKAQAILKKDSETVIALSKIGRGMVVAVGDPWLYNEYIDNRRLPDSFENWQAAQNLVKWLLENAPVVRDVGKTK